MKVLCPKHGRYVKLVYADGRVVERPCPECPTPKIPVRAYERGMNQA